MNKPLIIVAAAALLATGSALYFTQKQPTEQARQTTLSPVTETALVQIAIPETLSENATLGKQIYEAKCATCHAPNAVGQDGVAPPLVHGIYEPNHHGDEAFQRAAANGVKAHHWRFGDMPPVEGLTRADVAMIVAYIRELQRENGIQ